MTTTSATPRATIAARDLGERSDHLFLLLFLIEDTVPAEAETKSHPASLQSSSSPDMTAGPAGAEPAAVEGVWCYAASANAGSASLS